MDSVFDCNCLIPSDIVVMGRLLSNLTPVHPMGSEYKFESPLKEGLIKSRPNRFIMIVEGDASVMRCHCPSTGRIGDIVFKDIPCLLSEPEPKSHDRKTECTVEAISVDPIGRREKTWVGINQTMANRYLEHFIITGQMEEMLGSVGKVKREVKLGSSRIDFAVGDILLEVKSPLTEIPFSASVAHRELPAMTSFDRLIKHFGELSASIEKRGRAILLLCYQYDAEAFKPPPMDKANERIEKAAMKAEKNGLETWQANLKIDRFGVSLLKYFKLNLFG
jgi:sugar fermentation stimulation protein A